jgi:SRSO17 transposase
VTEHWARDVLRRFGEFAEQFADCFGRCVQRTAASQYIEGLLNDSERKSMQAMHGRLTDPITYQALQHFITHSPWDANQLWLRLRALVSDRSGILALDGTGLPKQGKHSVGVKRQYCGALGKTGNCEVAVSTVLIGDRLVWPLSCELFLPKEWVDDETRRAEVGIPDGTRLREKWRIALAHVRLVRGAGFHVSAVVADADYGSTSGFRHGLEREGLRYGVAIRSNLLMRAVGTRRSCTAADLVRSVAETDWRRVCRGHGTKGPLAARFVALRVRLPRGRGDRWLLCERSLADDERKYYLLNLEPTASLDELVRVARSRWPVEQQYRGLKDELGFDHFEGRTLPGWQHHAVLTAAAFTFLQLERRRWPDASRPALPPVRLWMRDIAAILYVLGNRQLNEAPRQLRAESAAEKMTR